MSLISLISCKWLFMWKIFFLRYCCFHSVVASTLDKSSTDPHLWRVKQNITNIVQSVQKFFTSGKQIKKSPRKKTACFFFFFFGVLIYIDKKNKRRWPGSTRYCKIEKKWVIILFYILAVFSFWNLQVTLFYWYFQYTTQITVLTSLPSLYFQSSALNPLLGCWRTRGLWYDSYWWEHCNRMFETVKYR